MLYHLNPLILINIFLRKRNYFLGEFIYTLAWHPLIGMLSSWHLADARHLERKQIWAMAGVCVCFALSLSGDTDHFGRWNLFGGERLDRILKQGVKKGTEKSVRLTCLFQSLNPERKATCFLLNFWYPVLGGQNPGKFYLHTMLYQYHWLNSPLWIYF